jgi:hypothetical protein
MRDSPEPTEQRCPEGQDDGEEEHRHDRDIDARVLPLDANIPWQSAKPREGAGPHEEPDQGEGDSGENDGRT